MSNAMQRYRGLNLSLYQLPANSERFWRQLSELEAGYPRGVVLVEAMFAFQLSPPLKELSLRGVNTALAVYSGCKGLKETSRREEFLLACRELLSGLLEQFARATLSDREAIVLMLEGVLGSRADFLRGTKGVDLLVAVDKVFGLEQMLAEVAE